MKTYNKYSEVYIAEGFCDFHHCHVIKIGEAQNACQREKGLEDYLFIRKKYRLPSVGDELIEASQRKAIEALLRCKLMNDYELTRLRPKSMDYFICSEATVDNIINCFADIIEEITNNLPFDKGEILEHETDSLRRAIINLRSKYDK